MNYLDPAMQKRHQYIMIIGYVLIAAAIVIATIVLLYQAYGFGLGKNGSVIQSGLVFVSSQPVSAQIHLDGNLYKSSTNTRILLPAGIHSLTLSSSGYRDWKRTITVNGGSVSHYDYPLLIPLTLSSSKLQTFQSGPGMATQSLDRRWLMIELPGQIGSFYLYDLKNPTKTPTTISLPSGLLSKATESESWQAPVWADDNQHLLLKHVYDNKQEYILLDRQNPDQSLNLNTLMATNPSTLTLVNRKYDNYYLLGSDASTMMSASIKNPIPVTLLSNVISYQSYGSNDILYVTSTDAPAGKVLVKLISGTQTYILRSFPAGTSYPLAMTQYNGVSYVAVGAASENKIYIYKDPVGQLNLQPTHAITPIQVLHVTRPSALSFSDNAQFIVAENGNQFGVYDIENMVGYNYSMSSPLDPPQLNASWMDGDRLTYVSGGKVIIFDYDGLNVQSLVVASSSYLPFFAPDYKNMFNLSPPNSTGQIDLAQTSLVAGSH